jgi:maleate cis-trans isomerase
MFAGFEIYDFGSASAPLNDAQAALLLNPTGSASLLSATGLATWLAALNGVTSPSATATAAATALVAALEGKIVRICHVLTPFTEFISSESIVRI